MKASPSRRAVLGGAGSAGLLAVAAGLPGPAAAREPPPAKPAAAPGRRGYHETDRIRTYYQLARY